MDDSTYIGWTLDTLIAEMLAGDEDKPFADVVAWAANGDAVRRALSDLDRSGDRACVPAGDQHRAESAALVLQRPLQAVLSAPSPNGAPTRIVRRCSPTCSPFPADEAEAARKILRFKELADNTDRLYPGAGFSPNACAMLWCFQDPRRWPYLSTDAESVLAVLRVLPKTQRTLTSVTWPTGRSGDQLARLRRDHSRRGRRRQADHIR